MSAFDLAEIKGVKRIIPQKIGSMPCITNTRKPATTKSNLQHLTIQTIQTVAERCIHTLALSGLHATSTTTARQTGMMSL
jgi:hypothetical protein